MKIINWILFLILLTALSSLYVNNRKVNVEDNYVVDNYIVDSNGANDLSVSIFTTAEMTSKAVETIEVKYGSVIDPIDGEQEYVLVKNTYTSPTLQIIHYHDGSMRQVFDDDGTSVTIKRKLSLMTNTGLQIESVPSIDGFNLHGKKWQLPKNSTWLLTQYQLDEEGLKDFDNPAYFTITGTNDTITTIQWIRSGFELYPISTGTFVRIWWDESIHPDFSHYNLYRSDVPDVETLEKINEDPILALDYYDFGPLEKGKTYYYAITAEDVNGNESEYADQVSVDLPSQ